MSRVASRAAPCVPYKVQMLKLQMLQVWKRYKLQHWSKLSEVASRWRRGGRGANSFYLLHWQACHGKHVDEVLQIYR